MKELRPKQKQAIDMIRHSLAKGNKRIMVKAPTGFGKTVIAASIIDMALRKGSRVIFCVNAISLVDQTAQKFFDEGISDIGVIQGSHELTNYAKPVQVCSIQTLARRKIPDAELVIVDEAHNWFKFYAKWMNDWNAVPFIGLSATPYTKGLGKYYDDLIIPATTAELIDDGLLSRFRVYGPSSPDLSKVRTLAGDYHEGDLAGAMDKATLIADIVSTWKRLGENRPTLCYGVNRAHAKHIQQQFEESGIPCGYIDSFTELDERREISDKFHRGEIKIICNVGVLTTGIDWDVRCIILARPTKSDILFQQIIGRGLRTAEGKDDCIVLDHSDTHQRLGFVTDIDGKYLSLCDGSPKEKSAAPDKPELLPKPCPKCHFMKPPKTAICPACGFKPEKQSGIKNADGELVEIGAKEANNKYTTEQKLRFLGELKFYAMSKGYSLGWASHAYKDKFGVWPKSANTVPPIGTTELTAGFIKHRNIKQSFRAKPKQSNKEVARKALNHIKGML